MIKGPRVEEEYNLHLGVASAASRIPLTPSPQIVFLCNGRTFYHLNYSFGYLSKYALVSLATRPLKTISEIQFGIAIKPFVMSAIVHTAEIVM